MEFPKHCGHLPFVEDVIEDRDTQEQPDPGRYLVQRADLGEEGMGVSHGDEWIVRFDAVSEAD